jgi:5-formyltetrahydrofolate cyclo-ligase
MKAELRKRMRALRATHPAGARSERSTRLVDRLAGLDPIVRARSVALFSPIAARCEVELSSLDPLLRARGVRIAYPRLVPEVPGAMEFRFVPYIERMREHRLGMREPCAGEPLAAPGDLDAIVVPALAADSRGQRIGYGGGIYDRALPLYAPPAIAIAVIFDFQLVVEIPSGDHDVAVDWVVTDARAIQAER